MSPESNGSGPYNKFMYYVYILQSKVNGSFYIGCTSDLKRRFFEHNSGKSVYTSRLKPFDLIFYEAYISKHDAQRREIYLKSSKGKTTMRTMLKEYLILNGSID
ncbi:MAG: GIY-YIG nuclease family protein [Patescibacteria group bacterium]|nr:GIY-YIG nuclease family protein [Patescibacteria group bacterium]